MRIKNWSFPYALGYVLVYQGIRGFYKKFQAVGLENIPKDKPVIFAANHQNAFMDPVVIAVHLKKPVYYMVRADIFKKPAVAKILASINMMAIYRQRDGGNTIEKNKAVFDYCYDLLQKNRPIIIFVEGNQGKEKNLRPVQKGVFRIGLGAEEKYNNELDVHIVPIGIYYSDTVNMGSKMLINYGKPLKIKDYLAQYDNDEAKTINSLKSEVTARMGDLMVDIKSGDYYTTVHELMFAFEKEIFEKEGGKKNSVIEEFNCQKGFIAKAEKWIEENPSEAQDLKTTVEEFSKEVPKQGLRYWLFQKEKQSPFIFILFLIIGFPIHLYGILNSYLPYKLPAIFVKKKIKDIHFHSSLKMAMGTFLFWVFWALQTFIVALCFDYYIWAYYFVSLPITALISYRYWITILKTKGMLKYNKLSKSKDAQFLQLKEKRDRMAEVLEKIYAN